MALSACVAARRSVAALVLFALAAGAFEDALSTLPSMTSPCFFFAVAVISNETRSAKSVTVLAYVFYQLWLKFLLPWSVDTIGTRLVLAPLIAAVTVAAVGFVLPWTERKAAIDAQ